MKIAMHALHAVAALVLFSANVSAQIPDCAKNCVNTLLGSSGCDPSNFKCICQNQSFISDITCCVIGVCTSDQLQSVIQFADGICAGVGVTTLPQTAVCSSTTGSAATSSATGSVSSSSPLSTTTTSTVQVPSCYNADPSATTPCVLPIPLTQTSATNSAAAAASSSIAASASSVSAAISSSLASEVASASSAAAAASSTAAAAASTTTPAAASTAATGAASSTNNVGSLNGVKGMGIAGVVVGAAAGVMGILL